MTILSSAFVFMALFAALDRADTAPAFTIDLEVQSGAAKKLAHAEATGLGIKPAERPMLEANAGASITVRWKLGHTDDKATVKNVLVHFYAVKEDKAGQKTMPTLNKGVVAESALTMDFKPKDSAKGEIHIVIPKAGAYLLRLETIGAAAGTLGQEYFAAMDLVIR